MKKIKFLAMFLAMLAVIVPDQAFATKRSHRSAKRTAKTTATSIKKTERTTKHGNATLTVMKYDSPAYYKLARGEDKGLSNGYFNSSFSIDWPIALSNGDVKALQEWLLTSLKKNDEVPSTVEQLIQSYNKVSDLRVTPVSSIKKSKMEDALRSIHKIEVDFLTNDVLVVDHDIDWWYGGGLGSSYVDMDTYSYYHIGQKRGLGMDDLFNDQVLDEIVAKLKSDDGVWEDVWGEFKAKPSMPQEFEIEDDGVTFVYLRNEIASGAAGNVEVELPFNRIRPYATPLMKSIIGQLAK